MADKPRIQQPYPNISTPSGKEIDPEKDSSVPSGPKVMKKSRAQLALQGLIGIK